MGIRARGPKRWEVVVYLGKDPATGRERRLSRIVRGTKKQARDRELELLYEHRHDTAPADITFDELADRWLQVARHEKSTRARTDSYLDKHVRPRLGLMRIHTIRAAELDAFYLDLESKGLSASTVVRIHGIVRACLEQAVTWDWIATNPARRASPPEIARTDPQAPTVDQVLAVLDVARTQIPEMHTFLRLMAATGLRPGSICGLHHDDLDLEARTLRHHRAVTLAKGGAYEKATKSGGRHAIALDRRTVATLRWHAWRMSVRARRLDTMLMPTAYLFSEQADCVRPWGPDLASKRYRRLADTAGVKVPLYNWRHFHATQLLDAGHDPKTVSGRLTHARTSTTLDRYAAHVPASDQAAAATIGRVLDGT